MPSFNQYKNQQDSERNDWIKRIRFNKKSDPFSDMPFFIRDNKEMVREAINVSLENFKHVSARLKLDKNFIEGMLTTLYDEDLGVFYDPGILGYADRSLIDDQEFIMRLISKGVFAYEYSSDRLKKNKDFTLEAIKNTNSIGNINHIIRTMILPIDLEILDAVYRNSTVALKSLSNSSEIIPKNIESLFFSNLNRSSKEDYSFHKEEAIRIISDIRKRDSNPNKRSPITANEASLEDEREALRDNLEFLNIRDVLAIQKRAILSTERFLLAKSVVDEVYSKKKLQQIPQKILKGSLIKKTPRKQFHY